MTTSEQQAIIAIALLAAFADGSKADVEREAIRRMAQSLGHETDGAALAQIYQDVLLTRVTLSSAVAGLTQRAHQQLAYEMALCVCEADGQKSPAEAAFLAELKSRFALEAADTAAFEREEAELVEAATQAIPPTLPRNVGAGAAAAMAAPAPLTLPDNDTSTLDAQKPTDAELDSLILSAAKLNGALELLPQSWASMAIIPLQIRMVYNIGRAHGVELDQGHIKEFIAAAGVGISSQYIEQFGRKLLGGLLGKVAGRMVGGIGRAATGMAFSFASTYALGQLAKRYYAGGREMNTQLLQQTYESLLAPAKQLQNQYLPQIQQTASTLDAGKVLAMVRGNLGT